MEIKRSGIGARLARGGAFLILMILYRLFIPEEREKLLALVTHKPLLTVAMNGTRTLAYLTPRTSSPYYSPYYTAPPGQKLLICDVTVTYSGRDRGMLACRQSDFVLQDNEGAYHRGAQLFANNLREVLMLNVTLNPGVKMRGDVVFVVPQATVATKVEYRPAKKIQRRVVQ